MAETERAVVKTYVPAEQKTRWQEHADELDMSQSEFLRSMVQAGRRGFNSHPPEDRSSDATPGVASLEDHLLDILAESGYIGFDDLVEDLTADIESRVDETLQSLVAEGRVRHSNLEGGYALAGGADGNR